MLVFFLKLAISKQIQLGVTIVVLTSIILFQILILIAIFIQLHYILNFFYSLIEYEENSLMRNYNLMLEKYEILVLERIINDNQLVRIYLNNLLNNEEVMVYYNSSEIDKIIKITSTLSQSKNVNNYFLKSYDNAEDKDIITKSALLESILSNIIKDTNSLYGKFKLYTKNSILCFNKNQECLEDLNITQELLKKNIYNSIDKCIYYITTIIPKLNAKYNFTEACKDFDTINNQNSFLDFTYTQSISKFSFPTVININYSKAIKSNSDIICQLNNDTLFNAFKYYIEIDLNNTQFESLITEIIPFISNAFFIITDKDKKILTKTSCDFLRNYSNSLQIYEHNHTEIKKCFDNPIDSLGATYTNLDDLIQSEDYNFIIRGNSQDNKIEDNPYYHFRMSISYFPTDSSGILNMSKYLFVVEFFNYIIYNNNREYSHKNLIFGICLRYFIIIALFNYILWVMLIIYIIIRVLFISWKISKPIDDLIQSISQNNCVDNQAQGELKKKLEKISYKDDYIINELFMLCKKLIIGGFKQFAEQQKKRMKLIQANDSNTNTLNDNNNRIGTTNDNKRKDYFGSIDKSSIEESSQSNSTITIGNNDSNEEISLMKHFPNQKEEKEFSEIKSKVTFKAQEKNYLYGYSNPQQENHLLCRHTFKKIFLNHEENITQENEYYSILKSLGEGVGSAKASDNDSDKLQKKNIFHS